LFPDLYMRRYRDQLEISTGAEPVPGVPREYSFVVRHRTYRLDIPETSSLLFEVLGAAVTELRRKLPGSVRLSSLESRLRELANPHANRLPRLMLLSGFRDDPTAFSSLADAVNASFEHVGPDLRAKVLMSERDGDLATVGTAYARLLYGAFSPEMTAADVMALATALVNNYSPNASLGPIERFDGELTEAAADVATLTPGAQGSVLGELVCEKLGTTARAWVDVAGVLADLQVKIQDLALSDQHLRAVSVFGEMQPPVVFCNSSFSWGLTDGVKRFTLAHELCHLLLDRELGEELAVASGPWAPVDIEQRANAFAAAFLMPTWLLREHVAADALDLHNLEALGKLAAKLRVSLISLVDRLYNLHEITSEERLILRTAVTRTRTSRSQSDLG